MAKNSSFFSPKYRSFVHLGSFNAYCWLRNDVFQPLWHVWKILRKKRILLSTNGGSCERKNCREKILEGSRIFFYSIFRENFFGRRFRSDKKRICARMMPRNDSPQEGITNPCGFERHQSPLIVLSQLFLRKKAGGEHNT